MRGPQPPRPRSPMRGWSALRASDSSLCTMTLGQRRIRLLVMIRVLDDMPAGVLGFEAVDDVKEEDYANVLVPAIEQAITEHGKVRIVYVLGPEFDEYEGGAAWEDLKLGAHHPASFERMAIVSDARWAGPAVKVFSILWPGQARAFPVAELESAKRWAADRTS